MRILAIKELTPAFNATGLFRRVSQLLLSMVEPKALDHPILYQELKVINLNNLSLEWNSLPHLYTHIVRFPVVSLAQEKAPVSFA